MSSTKVSVRLSPDASNRYSAEAHQRRVSLATYLRQRLEEQDRAVADIAIRAAAEHDAAARTEPAANGTSNDSGTLVEVLLLLRSVAGPQKSAMVRKEVERLGLSSGR